MTSRTLAEATMGNWVVLKPDPANFKRLESPTRRAFLEAVPPLAAAALCFGVAGLVFASCDGDDSNPPPAHSNGTSKTKKSTVTGQARSNGHGARPGG